jgi:hypothetical protein
VKAKVEILLKVLTPLAFCGIGIDGGHLGGPLILLLLFSLASRNIMSLLVILVFGSLLAYIYSAINPNKKRDKYLITTSTFILLVALSGFITENDRYFKQILFVIPFFLFIVFSSFLLFFIFSKKGSNT